MQVNTPRVGKISVVISELIAKAYGLDKPVWKIKPVKINEVDK